MSIFGSIMSKIFGSAQAATGAAPAASAPPPEADAPTPGALSGLSSPQPTPSAAASSGQPVDVDAVLTQMQSTSGQTLNWRSSIVDLMKLLDLDSSLQARKTLAGELHYTGDTDDSATMNVWLHKQVMQKLEENGGKVPADLKG